MAKNVSVIARLAAVNRGFLKKLMSSIGWSVCSSQRMNATMPTTPMTNAAEHRARCPSRSTGPR